MILQLVCMAVHALDASFLNCPSQVWPISYFMRKHMYGKKVEVFIYGLSNPIIYFFVLFYCWCLSVTLVEKHQMIIRRKKKKKERERKKRKKGKKKIDLFHSSVWPWWHNSLEERHTWTVYLEAIVLHKQFCRLDLILYTFFLYLLPAQEPAQIATVLLPTNSSGKQGHMTGVHIC